MKKLALAGFAVLCVVYGGGKAQADPCDTAANLIRNCGFETGDLTSWIGIPVNQMGNWFGVDKFDALTGTYGAYIGGFGSYAAGNSNFGFLYQVPTLTTGITYTLSYNLAHNTSSNPTAKPDNFFDVGIFGSLVPNLQVVNAGSLASTQYSYTFVASASSTLLSFTAEDANFFFSLDNVLLAPAPEPASFLLVAPVMGGLFFLRRRRRIASCKLQLLAGRIEEVKEISAVESGRDGGAGLTVRPLDTTSG